MLACLASLGLDTAAQREELAAVTLNTCQIVARVAAGARHINRDDIDDVAQVAAIKSLSWLPRWRLDKSSWLTFVSVVARSAVADQGRKYKRSNSLAGDWAEYCQCLGDELQLGEDRA